MPRQCLRRFLPHCNARPLAAESDRRILRRRQITWTRGRKLPTLTTEPCDSIRMRSVSGIMDSAMRLRASRAGTRIVGIAALLRMRPRPRPSGRGHGCRGCGATCKITREVPRKTEHALGKGAAERWRLVVERCMNTPSAAMQDLASSSRASTIEHPRPRRCYDSRSLYMAERFNAHVVCPALRVTLARWGARRNRARCGGTTPSAGATSGSAAIGAARERDSMVLEKVALPLWLTQRVAKGPLAAAVLQNTHSKARLERQRLSPRRGPMNSRRIEIVENHNDATFGQVPAAVA
mmetsp:Transcript_78648/g.218371  ORF Transcript_78648/g.218371 Transcript_78648/m.218371 type:complete len:294 (-) Transcript_78648:89-970(-)